MTAFLLEIVRQGWLPGTEPAKDLCSHGAIRLVIGGCAITAGNEDYGISESALAMLRTLHADRIRGDALAETMILHGCGAMLGSGCGLGVDWTTVRIGDRIQLSNVVRYAAAGGGDAHEFPDLVADLSFADYSASVAHFARQARTLFETSPKRFKESELWAGEFLAFWAEFDRLLAPFCRDALRPLAS